MTRLRMWVGLFASCLLFPMVLWAAPPDNKPNETKGSALTSHQITVPPMVSPPLFRPMGQIHMRVKLVYAHANANDYVDHRLQRDIPELKHLYGFNAYRLLKNFNQHLSYSKTLRIRISSLYEVELQPTGYDPRTRKIALKATFFYQKRLKSNTTIRPSGSARQRLTAYATTEIRIKSGRKVAFVGPPHRHGRALLILFAEQLQ